MSKELELWQFVASHLDNGESVMLLVVAGSSGSSPGRAGYKMAVAADGDLCGSIGGGVMEVNLVELSRAFLSEPGAIATGFPSTRIIEQVHKKNSPSPSGMICSGKQTIILKRLTAADAATIDAIVESFNKPEPIAFEISNLKFPIVENVPDRSWRFFSMSRQSEFLYIERLGPENEIYIIGGGHCALALSAVAARLGFRVHIFDDRPALDTLAKNEFAHEVTTIDSYERIAQHVPSDGSAYLVVMTLGYASDAVVIRQLIDHDMRYFGVLGSKAKIATLMKELRSERLDTSKLDAIRTPIGLPINSRTPEEIAISIAAEIIAVKNA